MVHEDQIRLPEVQGELQLLMNILSVRSANPAALQIGVAMCGTRKDEYIKSTKFEMSVSMSYFSRFALKSLSKAIKLLFYSLIKAFLIGLIGSHY